MPARGFLALPIGLAAVAALAGLASRAVWTLVPLATPAAPILACAILAATACAMLLALAHRLDRAERACEWLQTRTIALEEGAQRKDELLASVSHEARTPLNVVLGYVDLLLDDSFGPLEPPQRDTLHRIGRNASNLSHLMNDLLDLSRIEAGRLPIEIRPVELPALFAELSTTMEVLLAGRNVRFVSSVEHGCELVQADVDRVNQILSNLLVNAAKFTEQGSISLRAERRRGGHVAISVTDTGVGIPNGAQGSIFEPFHQGDGHGRRAGGAGIGLSIAARLARLMGGDVALESTPGHGARFTLTLRAALSSVPEAAAA